LFRCKKSIRYGNNRVVKKEQDMKGMKFFDAKVLLLAVLLASIGTVLFAQQAVLKDFTGKVEIKAPGADWVPAAIGQQLEKATVISTGFKGGATIGIGNSVLSVGALTRLTLQEIQAGQNEQVSLGLQTGRIRAEVNPPAGGKTDFTVRSPSATASVRGTSFEFDGKQLTVDQGRVQLTGGDGTRVFVGQGHQVTTNTMNGRTPEVAETVRGELVPPAPAGVDSSSAALAEATVDPNIGLDGEISW
jgi:hypothetical protein